MTPKGKLLIIGGHEEKGLGTDDLSVLRRELHPNHVGILRQLISTVPRAHHVIEILATASAIPAEMEETYRQAYQRVGFTKIGFIRIEHEHEVQDRDIITRINYAHVVFFTGGDQLRLVSLLGGTKILTAIHRKYHADPHFIVAGTSAGAMAMSSVMIARGAVAEALLKSDLTLTSGLGIFPQALIDTHFVKRGRFGRLALAVALHPDCLGIGLGEDAALLIDGDTAVCSGSGMVILIDGSGIGVTNSRSAGENEPVSMENLKVHILAAGSSYQLREKQLLLSSHPLTNTSSTL